jgi:hypothetical protein
MGILTKRGMDNFAEVYDAFYKHNQDRLSRKQREKFGSELIDLPRGTVEIVGVWDTVGFQIPIFGHGEHYEFKNTLLSEDIKYAFQALALDEHRHSFKPVLWHIPKRAKKVYEDDAWKGQTELKQVWFSGAHSDIGGGMHDPRLSDITLVWMIAQCSKHNQLVFDPEYLLEDPGAGPLSSKYLWSTSKGKNGNFWNGDGFIEASILRVLSGLKIINKYVRTPGRYPPDSYLTEGHISTSSVQTNEELHISIFDRGLRRAVRRRGITSWPCPSLDDYEDLNFNDESGSPLKIASPLPLEWEYRGRIRNALAQLHPQMHHTPHEHMHH